jgi:amidase
VVAVPVGQDAQGLPFGVTVFAEPGSDALVLNVAEAIESIVGRRIASNLD